MHHWSSEVDLIQQHYSITTERTKPWEPRKARCV